MMNIETLRNCFAEGYKDSLEYKREDDWRMDFDELDVMERLLSRPETFSIDQQTSLVHNCLFLEEAASNRFYSDPKNTTLKEQLLFRLNVIRERFSKLKQEDKEKLPKERLDLFLVKFQQLLHCKENLRQKLEDRSPQITIEEKIKAVETQLRQIRQDRQGARDTIGDDRIAFENRQTAAQRLEGFILNENALIQQLNQFKYYLEQVESARKRIKGSLNLMIHRISKLAEHILCFEQGVYSTALDSKLFDCYPEFKI